MTASDSTFNLTAFANRLFLEKRRLPLANKIRRARDLQSLSVDLEIALENLNALDLIVKTPRAGSDFIRETTESALLNYALLLYARATKTTSEQRSGFDLRSRFSNAEKEVHEELVNLRDDAIAHFGPGGSYAGEWQSELVILRFKGHEAKPAVVTRRKMLDRSLAERARRQIEVARALLRSLSLEQLEEVTHEINVTAANDPEFHKEIMLHPLNLDIFLTSAEAAESALAFFEGGYAKSSVTHK